jgi:hypothetical protein
VKVKLLPFAVSITDWLAMLDFEALTSAGAVFPSDVYWLTCQRSALNSPTYKSAPTIP